MDPYINFITEASIDSWDESSVAQMKIFSCRQHSWTLDTATCYVCQSIYRVNCGGVNSAWLIPTLVHQIAATIFALLIHQLYKDSFHFGEFASNL